MLTDKEKEAFELYKNGCTCSQSVAIPFSEEVSLDKETIYKMMEGFGGGVGAQQEVCGAVSAMTFVISMIQSYCDFKGSSKQETYKLIRKACDRFKEEYGSIRCIEILHGGKPVHGMCTLKIKKAINILEDISSTPLPIE